MGYQDDIVFPGKISHRYKRCIWRGEVPATMEVSVLRGFPRLSNVKDWEEKHFHLNVSSKGVSPPHLVRDYEVHCAPSCGILCMRRKCTSRFNLVV